jgi:hypothetical protein
MSRQFIKNNSDHESHLVYINILKKMSPQQRLLKSFELTDFGKTLFLEGLKERHSCLGDMEIRKIYIERLIKCHNRNY